MNLGDMVLDALKYPFSNVSRAGGLFLLFLGSIFIIPVILAGGYIFRIIEHTINGSDELPPFDEWGNMLGDGLKYIAVSIIYLIVPNILIFVLFGGKYVDLQINTYLTTIIGFIISLPFDLVYIMALGNMVHEVRFGAAFDFSKIFGLIGKIGWLRYISYILVFVIIGFLLGIIVGFSISIPILFGFGWVIIGIILAVLIQIYLIIYRCRYVGLIYREGQSYLEDEQKIEGNSEENQDIGTV